MNYADIFIELNIPTNISMHNRESQMVKIQTNKQITVTNLSIPSRDALSPYYIPLNIAVANKYHQHKIIYAHSSL